MTHRGQVSRSEWRWAAMWIAVAMIVTSIPYLAGVLQSSPDRVFSGATFAVEDINSYVAKMRQGESGEWLFHIVYTSEPHDGALFFLFHILLGKLAALAGLPLEVMYHIARVLFGALLLIMTYRFIATFSGSTAIRRIAFLIVVFGGGLGWVLMLTANPNWLGSPPLDLILPEGFTFLVLYAMPHIALARTLLLAGLMLLWTASDQRSGLTGLKVGCLWSGMALIVPFYVAVVYAIVFGALAAEVLRSVDWGSVRRAATACAVAAVFPIYSVLVFSTHPVFAAWSRQNQIVSPHPLHYVMAYGITGGLALISMRWAWQRDSRWRYLAGWMLMIPPLLYLPFGLQRRLIESWQIPLSILAAVTLVRGVLPRIRRSRPVRRLARFPRYTSSGLQRWALSALLLGLTPTFGLLLIDQTLRAAARQAPMFRDAGEVAALDWLKAQTTYADVVLAAYPTGNYLPARVSARAFAGHGPETINLAEKLPLVEKFYSATIDDAWREVFLREQSIDWVFLGPFEREWGLTQLSDGRLWELVYNAGRYRIYRVVNGDGSSMPR